MSAGRWVAAAAAVLGAGLGIYFLVRKKKATPAATTTPQEVEALARAIASEAGGEPKAIQIAVGQAVINESLRRSVTIWALVRGSQDAWGPQGQGGRSFVSSARAPTAAITELARRVLAGDEPDHADGATNFDSPQAQRKLVASGAPGYYRTPEEVAKRRIASGQEKVLVPGIPEERFRMWRYT